MTGASERPVIPVINRKKTEMAKKQEAPKAPMPVDDKAKAQADSEQSAKLAIRPSFGAALLITQYASPTISRYSAPSITAVADAASDRCQKAIDGDLSHAEGLLMAQAMSLNAIFGTLAEKAGRAETMPHMEAFMRMAMMAQRQSAQTIRVLGELKNPRQAATFVKQQNNAAGPQQVNNGPVTQGASARAHEAQEASNTTNELLTVTDDRESQHAATLDPGATSGAGRSNQALEAVGAVDRAAD
jgi:hypothetical protein